MLAIRRYEQRYNLMQIGQSPSFQRQKSNTLKPVSRHLPTEIILIYIKRLSRRYASDAPVTLIRCQEVLDFSAILTERKKTAELRMMNSGISFASWVDFSAIMQLD